MGRIERAFERRYRELFGELGARDRDKGIRWFKTRAEALSGLRKTVSHAHAELLATLLKKVHRFQQRSRGLARPQHFLVYCDAGLGGLARWLRAIGCEALWKQDITDADLVREARSLNAILITTDSLLLERRPITHGELRAIWVPPTLTVRQQLRLVQAELDLADGDTDSRCMHCGGELVEVDKGAVKERIPPRTYRWLNEFWECSSCHQLFWNGTHWRRIQEQLQS